MKIVTIVGARPQFIKAAPVCKALRKSGYNEFLVHTGQHYDDNMSRIFFKDLEIPEPKVNLGIGSGPHGRQTGQMLMRIEEILLAEKPDWLFVYGDTNSTLAGALAAVKLHIPVVHIEAGLRSFNREMPEEHNRVLTDHCSDLLFCPTQTAVKNLKKEGIVTGVHQVGDVMYDSALHNTKLAEKNSHILKELDLRSNNYALVTVHRAENTDKPGRLKAIFNALNTISKTGLQVVVPLHPRTRKKLNSLRNYQLINLTIINPISYMDMLLLEKHAKVILTDSGGIQKEAYWLRVPCVTLREETEWVETVESGWNVLAGSHSGRIIKAVEELQPGSEEKHAYGVGLVAEKIVDVFQSHKT